MPVFSDNLVMILSLSLGSGLMILEAFMPGFGVAGFFGVVLEVIAIVFAWKGHGLVFALLVTLGVLILIGVVVFFSYRSAMKGRLSKSPLILKDREEGAASAEHPLAGLVGMQGVAVTALRPGGSVEINGRRVPAASQGELLRKGEAVTAVGTEGDHLLVRKAPAQ